jgi:hypothetical protein
MAEALIQRLYDNEINLMVQFSSFYDGGFIVKIGDNLNGFRAEDQVKTWNEVEKWLRTKVVELYPDSKFAKAEMRGAEKPKKRKKSEA